ncbi:hypothetical protein ZIOFF_006687 [Zingiber officinale]|uniref:Uncharacterized protein n=1 Tax=Zingiber officinale TaxID=94328 RepID=A0A8J5HP04_ZINOF|nr:hypothetical protein ZIOFF_006687 [Zingiber officinale]
MEPGVRAPDVGGKPVSCRTATATYAATATIAEGGMDADMAEEGGDLPHLGLLVAGRAESERLVDGGEGDKGLVVPETDGMSDGGVALTEEVLELVDLEVAGYGPIAAVDAAGAPPPPYRTS